MELPKEANIPREFIWPEKDRPGGASLIQELDVPVVDLSGFLKGDDDGAAQATAQLIRSACEAHGFFQVINHNVDGGVIRDALDCMDLFFKFPQDVKMMAKKKAGSVWGYGVAHSDRFNTNLPWKETLTMGYNDTSQTLILDYFNSIYGGAKYSEKIGLVYEKYCKEMNDLSMTIMEILGMSLGVGRRHYREFFQESSSIMRCNYYPTCPEPHLTLGTGPHCDPASLTVLLQEDVGGLEVFNGEQWYSVSPVPGALVINIGDTFKALSNGMYKSCLHRAVTNRENDRKSIVFFLCPKADKILQPPAKLVSGVDGGRKYPDFTWSELLGFTQKHYRADIDTLQKFTQWLSSSSEAAAASSSSDP